MKKLTQFILIVFGSGVLSTLLSYPINRWIAVYREYRWNCVWMDRHLAYHVDPRQVPPPGLGPLEAEAIALISTSPRLSAAQAALMNDYLCRHVDVCYGAPEWRVHGIEMRRFSIFDVCDWKRDYLVYEEGDPDVAEATFLVSSGRVYDMHQRWNACGGDFTTRFVRENRMAEE